MAGAMTWNGTDSVIWCDGTNWYALKDSVGGAGGGAAAGSTGHVQFNGGSSTLAGDTSLYWDNTNKRLGISTASPANSLDISGNTIRLGSDLGVLTRTDATTKTSAIITPHYTNAEEPLGGFMTSSTYTANVVAIGGGWATLNTATNIRFYTAANNTTTTGSERVRIDENGNVGIGTMTPGSALQVAGDITPDADSTHYIGSDALRFGSIYTRGVNATTNTLGIYGGAVLFNIGGTDRLRVNEGLRVGNGYVNTAAPTNGAIIEGGVGIGMAMPSAKLQVAGAIVSVPGNVASGASVDLSVSNTIKLAAVGGATITLSNMVDGGNYTLVMQDTTSRTYTFSGCNTSKFRPANGATTASSQTIYNILTLYNGTTYDCYITWITGYQ